MNTSKLIQLRPTLFKNALTGTRFISLLPNKNRQLTKFVNNDPFDLAANLMRDLEREFQRTRSQLEKNFFNIDRNFLSLPIEKTSSDPIIVDKDGNRRFQMVFDLNGFAPEEIKVMTEGQNLKVFAKKEKKVGVHFLHF